MPGMGNPRSPGPMRIARGETESMTIIANVAASKNIEKCMTRDALRLRKIPNKTVKDADYHPANQISTKREI